MVHFGAFCHFLLLDVTFWFLFVLFASCIAGASKVGVGQRDFVIALSFVSFWYCSFVPNICQISGMCASCSFGASKVRGRGRGTFLIAGSFWY